MNSLSQLQINYMRLLMEKTTEEYRLQKESKDRIETNDQKAEPLMSHPQEIDYHFVEVAFDRMQAAEERAYLKAIPTSFTLPDKDVDRLREAASEIITKHPDHRKLMEELQEKNYGEVQ